MRSDFQSNPAKAAFARLLLLLLIVGSQASFAAHQFEHHADDLHETCTICVQLDRDDAPPPPPAPLACALPTPSIVPFGADATASAEGFSLYSARASP